MLINKSMYPVKAGYSAISTMQGQLGKLQTQLGNGQKAQNLAEMGNDRTVSLATRGRLTKLDSFANNIDTVNLRLSFLDQAFTSLNSLKSETRNSATPTSFGENGLVMASLQKDSENRLSQLLETLNLSVAGRYMMGGNKTDAPPVKSMDLIMNGQGPLDGFKTVVNERNRADLGRDVSVELGKLSLPSTRISGPHGNYLSVSSSMFDTLGYKLTSVSSNTDSIKTSGPTSNPVNQTASFALVPTAGNQFTVTLKRQDGTSVVPAPTLTAVSGLPTSGQFQVVDGDAKTSAGNFQRALEGLTVGGSVIGDLDTFSSISVAAAQGTGAPIPTDALKISGESDGADQLSIKLARNPGPNEKFSITLQGPDGTSKTLEFTARVLAPGATAGANEFRIGATRAETMESLEEAVKSSIGALEATVKTGRVDVVRTGAEVRLSKDASVAFGFSEISSISTTIGKSTVTPGPNPTIRFTGEVKAGESVSFAVKMPDGTSTTIELSAVTRNPGIGQFRIGDDAGETAANFEAALRVKLDAVAKTELVGASTYAAADDFFSSSGVPKRIDFGSGTGGAENAKAYFAEGSPEEQAAINRTVVWYTGEIADTNPRMSATAQVDDATKVGYGVRANEDGLLSMVKTLAAMSVSEYRNDDPTAKGRFSAMVERQMKAMSADTATNEGSVERIALELGVTKATVGRASERNVAYSGQLESLLGDIETVTMEETAMQLLALKTRLEASYQTTASVANLSLVNYLK